jgi:hypothetical protein
MFRLKHVPTGLYFCPSREIKVEGWYIKSNLSKSGKIYAKRPSFKYVGNIFYSHLSYQMKNTHSVVPLPENISLPFVDSEWVIEEITNA